MATSSSITCNSLDDFPELSNGELQYYLQQRGLPMSGTHGTLAARALIAHEQKIECVATAAHLLETLKSDYGNLLSFFGIKEDPLLSSNFVDDIKCWPNTNIGQIFAYFLENKAYETEYIGQYKLRKAYTFFKYGFVDKLLVKSVEEGRTIIRASVTPSQRLNDDKHQLWIVFKSDGSVITGFCTCTTGHSRCCNHIAAVLYKLNYANEKGYTNPACTDEVCNWNSSSKEIHPMKVKDMDILQHNLGKSKQKSFLKYPEKLRPTNPRPTTEREISEFRKQSFLSGVRTTLPKATLNISFSLPQCEDIPPSLEDIAQEVDSCRDKSNVNNLFTSKLSFNDSQIHELEKATRNQSNSQIWRLQRKGRVTASRFHEVDKKCKLYIETD